MYRFVDGKVKVFAAFLKFCSKVEEGALPAEAGATDARTCACMRSYSDESSGPLDQCRQRRTALARSPLRSGSSPGPSGTEDREKIQSKNGVPKGTWGPLNDGQSLYSLRPAPRLGVDLIRS